MNPIDRAKQVQTAIQTFIATNPILPPNAVAIDENNIPQWPFSIGIGGKLYEIDYTDTDGAITISGVDAITAPGTDPASNPKNAGILATIKSWFGIR